MIRLIVVLGCLYFALVSVVRAADESGWRRQSYVYPPMLLEDIGPGLDPEVNISPPVDRSRAYLLDIAEEEFTAKQPVVFQNLWGRIRDGFALPPLTSSLVADRELWYGKRKDLIASISEKARRYLFHIVEAVEKRGLPMELALLPVVESGFEPGAVSAAQAAGLWQFIPGTAERYSLKLNEHYDARRDIVASTEAALDYLEFLHGLFEDWQLALAAYNWGEEAVLRAVKRNQAKGLPADFESLILPEETRSYLPKLMAIRNIVMHPEWHGIVLAEIPNRPYFAKVDIDVSLDIKSVAKFARSSVEEILALNPSHKSVFISGKGKPAVLLPVDQVDEFKQNIADYSAKSTRSKKNGKRKNWPNAVVGLKAAEEKPL